MYLHLHSIAWIKGWINAPFIHLFCGDGIHEQCTIMLPHLPRIDGRKLLRQSTEVQEWRWARKQRQGVLRFLAGVRELWGLLTTEKYPFCTPTHRTAPQCWRPTNIWSISEYAELVNWKSCNLSRLPWRLHSLRATACTSDSLSQFLLLTTKFASLQASAYCCSSPIPNFWHHFYLFYSLQFFSQGKRFTAYCSLTSERLISDILVLSLSRALSAFLALLRAPFLILQFLWRTFRRSWYCWFEVKLILFRCFTFVSCLVAFSLHLCTSSIHDRWAVETNLLSTNLLKYPAVKEYQCP